MKYYTVAELDFTDRAWTAAYVKAVTPLIEQNGGRYLARTNHFETMEAGSAAPPHLFLLIEWPSREAALKFYESEEYRPFKQSRLEGSKGPLYLIPGEDVSHLAKL
jgi:uncharacterized protein (DUF1330 family)